MDVGKALSSILQMRVLSWQVNEAGCYWWSYYYAVLKHALNVLLPSMRDHFRIQSSYSINFITSINDLEFSDPSQALIWGLAGLEQEERDRENTDFKSTGFERLWNKITLNITFTQCLIFSYKWTGDNHTCLVISRNKKQCQVHKNAQLILAMSINFPHHTVLASATGYLKLPFMCMCLVTQPSLTLWPHGPQPNRLLCPWDSPGKNTGVGCHALLQGIFPTQGSNPGLLHVPNSCYYC